MVLLVVHSPPVSLMFSQVIVFPPDVLVMLSMRPAAPAPSLPFWRILHIPRAPNHWISTVASPSSAFWMVRGDLLSSQVCADAAAAPSAVNARIAKSAIPIVFAALIVPPDVAVLL